MHGLSQAAVNFVSLCVSQGKAIGVALGCLLGMFPLLFFSEEKKDGEETPQAAADSKAS